MSQGHWHNYWLDEVDEIMKIRETRSLKNKRYEVVYGSEDSKDALQNQMVWNGITIK